MFAWISIPLAYLIGSISSSYIVGRLSGAFDTKTLDDGRISAAAIYRNLGPLAFLIVVLMDIGLATSAVIIARLLTDSLEIALISGFAAVAGHDWSIFLKFRGGLGATAIAGVLCILVPVQLFYGLGLSAVVFFITHRTGLSTATALVTTSSVLFIQQMPAILAIYPVTLLTLMLLKRWQADGATKLAHWDR